MSISVAQVINQALWEPGINSWGDPADGDQAAMALTLFNNVVAQLNTENFLPFAQTVTDFTTTGDIENSIGVTTPASDVAVERPVIISKCFWLGTTSSTPQELTKLPWGQLISTRKPTSATGTPMYWSYNSTYPAGTIGFDIIPSTGSTLRIVYNRQLETAATQTDTMPWPPEYQELITLALARRLASANQMPQDTMANIDGLYQQAIARVKSLRSAERVPLLGIPRRPAGWGSNLLTGTL